ncbi:MAG: biopolymer transporter ExbD [Bacteroidetes bacterium]|nr:MAG: biopolymer transporter ExbD [Bacteroidota bacterium]
MLIKGRFRKDSAPASQKINTASLPDIIFMLLFFFMVTTTMRETTLFVRNTLPPATEIQKLERKSLVSFIYIGSPLQSNIFGTEPRIQLNDTFASLNEIASFVESERQARPENERPIMIFSMKIDRETKMGIVTDVKQELRLVNALNINYSTTRGEVRGM